MINYNLSFGGQIQTLTARGETIRFTTSIKDTSTSYLYELNTSHLTLHLNAAYPITEAKLLHNPLTDEYLVQGWQYAEDATSKESKRNVILEQSGRTCISTPLPITCAELLVEKKKISGIIYTQNNQLIIEDWKRQQCHHIDCHDQISAIALDASQTWLAIGMNDGCMAVYQWLDEQWILSDSAQVHSATLTQLAFDLAQLTIYSVGHDQCLFETYARGKLVPTKRNQAQHKSPITAFTLGERLYTASTDGNILSWQKENKLKPASIIHKKLKPMALALASRDGKPLLICASQNNIIHFLPLADDHKPTVLSHAFYDGYDFCAEKLAESAESQRKAIDYLQAWDDQQSLKILVEFVQNQQSELKIIQAAVSVIGQSKHLQAKNHLLSLVKHPRHEVRQQAFDALPAHTTSPCAAFVACLESEYVDIIQQSFKGLIHLTSQQKFSATNLRDHLARFLEHSNPELRVWILDALFAQDTNHTIEVGMQHHRADIVEHTLLHLFKTQQLTPQMLGRALNHNERNINLLGYLLMLAQEPSLLQFLLQHNATWAEKFQELKPWFPEGWRLRKSKTKPKSEAMHPLIRACHAMQPHVAVWGMCDWALLKDEHAYVLIKQAIQTQSDSSLIALLHAIHQFKKDEVSDILIDKLTTSEHFEIRQTAWALFCERNPAPSLAPVDFAMQSQHGDVQQWAFEYWRQHVDVKTLQDPSSHGYQQFSIFLNSQDAAVSEQSIQWFLTLKQGLKTTEKIQRLGRCQNASVRFRAYQEANASIHHSWASQLLVEGIQDPALINALFCFNSLQTYKNGQDFSLLVSGLTSLHLDVRLHTLQALSQHRHQGVVQLALAALVTQEQETHLRLNAMQVLVNSNTSQASPEMQLILEPLLTCTFEDIRLSAATYCNQNAQATEILLKTALAPKPEKPDDQQAWRENRIKALHGLSHHKITFDALIALIQIWHDLNQSAKKSQEQDVVEVLVSIYLGNLPHLSAREKTQCIAAFDCTWQTSLQPSIDLILAYLGEEQRLSSIFQSNASNVNTLVLAAYHQKTSPLFAIAEKGSTNAQLAIILLLAYVEQHPKTAGTHLQQLAYKAHDSLALSIADLLKPEMTGPSMLQALHEQTGTWHQAHPISAETWEILWQALTNNQLHGIHQGLTFVDQLFSRSISASEAAEFNQIIHNKLSPLLAKNGQAASALNKVLNAEIASLHFCRFQTYLRLANQSGRYQAPACEKLALLWQEAQATEQTSLWQLYLPAFEQLRLNIDTFQAATPLMPIYQALYSQSAQTTSHWCMAFFSEPSRIWHQLAVEQLIAAKNETALETVALTLDNYTAFDAFHYLNQQFKGHTKKQQAFLERALNANNTNVIFHAINALKLCSPASLYPLLNHTDSTIFLHVAKALAALGEQKVYPPLHQCFINADNERIKFQSFELLAMLSRQQPLPHALHAHLIEYHLNHQTSLELKTWLTALNDVRDESLEEIYAELRTTTDRALHGILIETLIALSQCDQPFTENGQLPFDADVTNRHEKIIVSLLSILIAQPSAHKRSNELPFVLKLATPCFTSDVEPYLLQSLHSPHDELVKQAIAALAWRIQHRNMSTEELINLLSHTNHDIRFLAAEILAKHGQTEGQGILLSSIDSLSDLELRGRAVIALGYCHQAACFERLLTLVNDAEHALHAHACEAIGQFAAANHQGNSKQRQQIERRLIAACQHSDWLVRYHALMGCRWLENPQGWQCIVQGISDHDRDVQERALDLLKHAPAKLAKDLILALLARKPLVQWGLDTSQIPFHIACSPTSLNTALALYPESPEVVYAALLASGIGLNHHPKLFELGEVVHCIQHAPINTLLSALDQMHPEIYQICLFQLPQRSDIELDVISLLFEQPLISTQSLNVSLEVLLTQFTGSKKKLAVKHRQRLMAYWYKRVEEGKTHFSLGQSTTHCDHINFNAWCDQMSALIHVLGVMQLNEASLQEARQLFAHIAPVFSAITQALSYAEQTSTTPELMLQDAELKQALYSSQSQASAIQQILTQGNEAILVAQVQDAETPELLRLGALLGLENSSSPVIESYLIQLGQDEMLDKSYRQLAWRSLQKVRRRLVKIQKAQA